MHCRQAARDRPCGHIAHRGGAEEFRTLDPGRISFPQGFVTSAGRFQSPYTPFGGCLMAGETRGELAEAIAMVATQEALRTLNSSESAFWEETPDAAAIRPDITTGRSKNLPTNVILVNASDSPKESEKKFWRNIGEIFDCKTRLAPRPTVIALFFKSEIKPELIKLTSALCDASHLVDRDPTHGPAISEWLESHHAKAPSKKTEKERLVREALLSCSAKHDPVFSAAFRDLVLVLAAKLFTCRAELNSLWELGRKDLLERMETQPREARVTLLRRGLARWLVFDDTTRARVLTAHYRGRGVPKHDVPAYAPLLGMLKLSLAGGVIPSDSGGAQDMVATTGSDLRLVAQFFRDAAQNDPTKAQAALATALLDMPEEMRRAAARLRAVPMQVASWHAYPSCALQGAAETPRIREISQKGPAADEGLCGALCGALDAGDTA